MDKTYRYPVFPVTSCPANAVDWKQAAMQRNCSLTGVRNTYMCLPNQEKTTLLEFCYDEVRPMVQEELAGSGTINQYGCTMFTAGCPKNPYLSDFIYNHSSCLNINTQYGCYHEDPSCPKKTFNGLERDLTYLTTGEYWLAGLVIGILVLIAVFILIISWRRIYRFLRSGIGGRRHHHELPNGAGSRNQGNRIPYAQSKVSSPAPPPPPPPPSNT
uniref:Uncharacterized protein LOC111103131 isoform X2 n=1 Tax=Crassostrea virginica TaxID=6565 RepID=A0A8B8AL14_CRAVI|nr:uncharacterized protein LOC111103131 isoform X2 [Crassostrea virginica]